MSNPRHSPDTRFTRRVVEHWSALRRHWLFATLVLLLSPFVGLCIAGDRGLLFGVAVGLLASFWIWWEGEPKPQEPGDRNSLR